MAIRFSDLQPYKSVLLCRIDSSNEQSVGTIIDQVRTLVEKWPKRENASPIIGPSTFNELETAFFHYVEKKPASWTSNNQIIDAINHLFAISRLQHHLAILCTDPPLRDRIGRIIDASDDSSIGQLQRIATDVLNSALVQGEAQTLWLSGTHRRVASRVDNKVLTGSDLRYALDPLGDQSFFFTAVRSRATFGDQKVPVGVAPRKSTAWLGVSRNWEDYCASIRQILHAVQAVKQPQSDPLPILATSIGNSADLADLRGAFDAAIIPAELLDSDSTPEERQDAERWSRLGFEITKTFKKGDFEATLSLDDKKLGSVKLTFDWSRPERVKWKVDGTRATGPKNDDFDAVLNLLQHHKPWLKVWYESGHVLVNGSVVRLRFRDRPFPDHGFLWADLHGYECSQEKPKDLKALQIGKEKSLFCWVKNHWIPHGNNAKQPYGWLACNDGAMEIADFIHLDDRSDVPVLTLMHVKGAHSQSNNRRASASPFEIVVGQAVKNLRHVDDELLNNNFMQRLDKRIHQAVWHNGKIIDRQKMLTQLKKLTPKCERRIIVFQPHLTESALKAARKPKPSSLIELSMRQLDALLLSARTSCLSANAEFFVMGAKG